MEAIEVSHLTFSYDGKNDILKDVSFSIPKGSYTTIIGHNGSGKSTMAKLIIGLLEAKKGKIQIDAMKKEKYNMNDLYTQLREKDVKSIDEVEYAILENNGRLSVFTYKDKDNETFPLPLIISGKIEKDNLKLIEKSEDWLLEMLKKQNIDNFENIYGASYQDGKIKVVLSDKKEVK